MTKKKLGYIELEWICPSCGGRNPGTRKSCQTCGTVMPEDIDFELPAHQELDTSAETAARVATGADFHCPYCGARNRGDATTCVQCGGDVSEGARRAKGKVLGAYQTGPGPDVVCPHCGQSAPATAARCPHCGGTLERQEPQAEPEKPIAETPRKRKTLWRIGILLGVAVVVWGTFQLARGRSKSVALVRGVSWTYTVEIEELMPVTREGWRDQVPVGARLGPCTSKVRRTESDPIPGATEVCGTPYVEDTGTGKGQVVQDCVYQVPDDWCEYTVQEWQAAGRKVTTGQGFDPSWPTFALASDQREGERSENYKVIFLVNDREHVYSLDHLEEFRQFQPGSEWTLKTNVLGGVTSLQRAD